eukprot:317838_1
MSTQNSMLIVYGYIRGIQHINKLAPSDIIQLCCLFWSTPLEFFIFSTTHTSNFALIYTPSDEKRSLRLFNIDSQKITNFIGPSVNTMSPPFCYIENISLTSNLKSYAKNSTYHAIIGLNDSSFYADKYLTVCLYPNYNNLDNNDIKYEYFESSEALNIYEESYKHMHQFLYCGKKHGIIYEYDNYLYQLKLQNMDFENKHFQFTKIGHAAGRCWGQKHFFRMVNVNQFLSMIYMKSEQILFGVNNQYNISWSGERIKAIQLQDAVTNCAVFDCNTLEWKRIADLKYKKEDDLEPYYVHEVCDNNKWDTNVIYIVSNKGHTARYHFKQNKWETLTNNCLMLKKWSKHTVWMDNNFTICCSDGKYFGTFDVRDHKRKWKKMQTEMDLVDRYQYQTTHIFLK